MRCHECGEASRVLETRKVHDGHVLRRRRICNNGHRFNSYEVGDSVYNAVSPTRKAQAFAMIEKTVALYARDLRLWRGRVLKRIKLIALALGEGMEEPAVRQAVLKFGRQNPEHTARLKEAHDRDRKDSRTDGASGDRSRG